MTKSETVPALPEGINIEELTPNDIHRISCWITANAIAAIAESGCATKDQITIEPSPKKDKWITPVNDYTIVNTGAASDLGAISIDARVHTEDTEYTITHGVIIESEHPQNFGTLDTDETVIVRSGVLRYWRNDEQGSDIDGSSTFNVLAINKGDSLKVQAMGGPVDYTCFYGDNGREHVKKMKNL